jgi:hypothetical protein
MLMNVLYHILLHYNIFLTPWLWIIVCITLYTIIIYCRSCDYECPVSLSTPLQYIVDPVIMNVLYYFLPHYNILLIPWLWMFCIILYIIAIYYWSHVYECPVSLSTPLQYNVDMNVLYNSILLIPWILMFCMTVYTISI